jgi:DNA polymerase
VDRIVNDRGVAFDSDLARRLLAVDARNGEIAIDRAARAWGESFEATRDLVFSPVELASVLGTADATAETIEAVAKEGGERGLLAEARIAIATITAGKLRAGLAGVSPDGRLRDMLRYYGAHTGRWSGKRLQPHNFTRPPRHLEDWKAAEIEAAIRDVQRGQIVDNDVLAILMRACITVAPGNTLVTEDFSGVEARALAWCAGDQRALDVFKSGRDPYKVEASELYRVPYDQINKVQRGIGKVMVLALGYGMGYAKFYANNAAALDAAGLNAKAVVKAWRTLHAPIVQYWKRLNDAFVAAVDGRATRVAPFDFIPSNDGNDVAVFLPSGRPIIYNAVGVSRDGRWPDGRPKTSPYYIGTKGNREHLYGGKLAENMVQALCRDLLAEALIKAEEAGLCPVLHVHDEIVCEVPEQVAEEAADELHRIMTTVPEWAEGFPAAGAGHTGKRYRK